MPHVLAASDGRWRRFMTRCNKPDSTAVTVRCVTMRDGGVSIEMSAGELRPQPLQRRYFGRPVEVHAYADRLVFRLNGKIVGEHRREFERDRSVYDPLHYLPVLRVKPGALQNGAPFRQWRLPEAIQQVCERLARFEEGDRQMVSILTAAQQLGWKQMTAACAEALSAGTCHADVVINLARRTVQDEPKTCIDTLSHLVLREPPKATCSRYDRRPGVNHGS